jgi:hypothetical protein
VNNEVTKLDDARENLKTALSMLHSGYGKIENAIPYAETAMEEIREILYEKTGSDFYRKKEKEKL